MAEREENGLVIEKSDEMEIVAIQQDHLLWNKIITFAEKCSWKAGAYLASKMQQNEFKDWERVIVATEGNLIAGYCTLTEKDELAEKYFFSPFIGFVFVDEKFRGHRVSEKMIECACNHAKELGYSRIYIMSGEQGLYEKYGFRKVGDYKTLYGTTEQLFSKEL